MRSASKMHFRHYLLSTLASLSLLLAWSLNQGSTVHAQAPAQPQDPAQANAKNQAQPRPAANAEEPGPLLTPQSPQVRAAVDRGVKFLQQGRVHYRPTTGRYALAALAMIKAGEPKDHPFVQRTLAQIKSQYEKTPAPTYESVYETSVCIIFLCALDPATYRREIEALLGYLISLQRPFGAFSMPGTPGMPANHGDTSMTQYAVLAFWECEKHGIAVPKERWQAVVAWLMRTQFRNGGFAYRPDTEQPSPVTHSMSAGGLGSCYIAAATAGVTKAPVKPKISDLPSALQPVPDKANPTGANRLGINTEALQNALRQGDDWFAKNYKVGVEGHQFYYLYSFERYRSFQEFVEQTPEPEPLWYHEMATFLLKREGAESRWGGPEDTSFAILFLVRSTQQGLNTPEAQGVGQGTLVGGRGLPLHAKELEMSGGKIRVKPLAGPAADLLQVMGNPNDERFEQAVAGLEQYVEQADNRQLSPFLVRLREMTGSDSPVARAAAIKGLSKLRNLEDAPFFIHALEDEDHRVSESARAALRYVSRRLEGFSPKPPTTPAEKQSEAKRWRQWYLALRPAAEFQP